MLYSDYLQNKSPWLDNHLKDVTVREFLPNRNNMSGQDREKVRKPEEELANKIVPLLDGYTLLEVINVLEAVKEYAMVKVYQTKPI